MKRTILAVLVALFMAGTAFAQIDPRSQTIVTLLNSVVATTTSSPYAITQLVANETILIQVDSPDAATGTFEIQGSLDTEAAVKAGTAKWVQFYSTISPAGLYFIEDPPPYIRVKFTRTAGTLRCLLRAAGARFREVTP